MNILNKIIKKIMPFGGFKGKRRNNRAEGRVKTIQLIPRYTVEEIESARMSSIRKAQMAKQLKNIKHS